MRGGENVLCTEKDLTTIVLSKRGRAELILYISSYGSEKEVIRELATDTFD